MIYKVAEAIRKSGPLDCYAAYEEAARAAIEAMREPTEDIVCSGDEQIIAALNDLTSVLRDPTPAKAAWQAMIDAAITPSPSSPEQHKQQQALR